MGICPLSMSDQPILAAVRLAGTRLLASSGVPKQARELPHGPSSWDSLLGESTSIAFSGFLVFLWYTFSSVSIADCLLQAYLVDLLTSLRLQSFVIPCASMLEHSAYLQF